MVYVLCVNEKQYCYLRFGAFLYNGIMAELYLNL